MINNIEPIRVTDGGAEYEVWSDGEQAVITTVNTGEENPVTLQLIEGKLHYVLIDGNRLPCSDDAEAVFNPILEKADVKLKSFTIDELGRPLIDIPSTEAYI